MSISVAPNVNIETLKDLSADKKYFLSSTTGKIKEASIWMRMKCAIGVASARQKVSNLVDAIRNSLLDAAEQKGNLALDEQIRAIDLKSMVEGRVIKDVVKNFSAQNTEKLLTYEAKKVAKSVANELAGQLSVVKIGIGGKDLETVIQHALKPVANDVANLPVTNDPDGSSVIDRKRLRATMQKAAKDVKDLIDTIAMDRRLSVMTIDKHYAKHIIDTLFNADGTRNDKGLADLKTYRQVKVDAAFYYDEKDPNSHPRAVYNLLTGKNIDVEQKVAGILSFCNKNRELEEFALQMMPELCVDSNMNLRSDDKIKKMLKGFEANLKEINTLNEKFPGCRNDLKAALKVLDGKSFPPGLLTRIADILKNSKLDLFANLNSLSSTEDMYEGIDQLYFAIQDVNKKIDFKKEFLAHGGDDFSGPQGTAARKAAVALAIAKIGPGLKARLPGIIQSNAFGVMNACMIEMSSHLNGKDYGVVGGGDIKRKVAHTILEEQGKFINYIGSIVNDDREIPVQAQDVGEVNLDEEPALSLRYILRDAADKEIADYNLPVEDDMPATNAIMNEEE